MSLILDCDLWPCIWSFHLSANFLVLLSVSVSRWTLLLWSCLAFQVLAATIFGVLGSVQIGRLASPDIIGPPRGVGDVALVVGLRPWVWETSIPFHLMPLTRAIKRM